MGKQETLIALLYDENTADEKMKALRAEIDAERERLASRQLLRRA